MKREECLSKPKGDVRPTWTCSFGGMSHQDTVLVEPRAVKKQAWPFTPHPRSTTQYLASYNGYQNPC
jgi:hypothetical protein